MDDKIKCYTEVRITQKKEAQLNRKKLKINSPYHVQKCNNLSNTDVLCLSL